VISFIETFACSSRIHCDTCRIDAQWRKNVGAPEECPFTDDERVPKKSAIPKRIESISPATKDGKLRLSQCTLNECGKFKCMCLTEFPRADTRCNDKVQKMIPGFMAWLDNPDNKCPQNLWRK
jgi:hypothetical protein